MRRLAALVPIVVLAGVLLAWRRRRERAAGGSLGASSPASPVALLDSGDRFVSVPWTLTAAPGDRAELTVRCAGTEHMQLDRVDAQETPTQVFVTVLMRWQPPAGGWFAWQREHEATVALSSPLGVRELVHAPVDLDEAAGTEPGGGGPSGPPLYP